MNRLPIELPPSQADIAASRIIRRHATPIAEHAGKVLTFAADEKPLLSAALLYWLYSRVASPPPRRNQADHLLACVAVSAALPHFLKLVINRQRPDRKLTHGLPRHGIPYSGNPNDSFPSGHAMHLGALAAALTRSASTAVAVVAWTAAVLLSGTRLLLLAHYVSDVLGGLAIGAAIEELIARVIRPQHGP